MSELKKISMELNQKISNSKLRGDEVLNGIAYDVKTKKTYLTGKDWKVIFEIEFL